MGEEGYGEVGRQAFAGGVALPGRGHDLSNVRLAGTIPEPIAAMPRLSFLAVDHNRLSGTVPAKLAAVPGIGAMWCPAS